MKTASFARLDPLGVGVLTNTREVLEWRGNWADHARLQHDTLDELHRIGCPTLILADGRYSSRGG